MKDRIAYLLTQQNMRHAGAPLAATSINPHATTIPPQPACLQLTIPAPSIFFWGPAYCLVQGGPCFPFAWAVTSCAALRDVGDRSLHRTTIFFWIAWTAFSPRRQDVACPRVPVFWLKNKASFIFFCIKVWKHGPPSTPLEFKVLSWNPRLRSCVLEVVRRFPSRPRRAALPTALLHEVDTSLHCSTSFLKSLPAPTPR